MRATTTFRRQALALAQRAARPAAIARHYLHLGERQRRTYFADARAVELKKLFYALRPALALRWLRLHPGEAIAPMHFPTLVGESALPAEILDIVEQLLAAKAATRELGTGTLPRPIGDLIDAEFSQARDAVAERAVASRGRIGRRSRFLLSQLDRALSIFRKSGSDSAENAQCVLERFLFPLYVKRLPNRCTERRASQHMMRVRRQFRRGSEI